MLDLLFDCASAEKAATAIRASLRKFKISLTRNVVSIIGDNANINDAIARELCLPRLRCVPHAIHLVFKQIMAPFKHYLTVTRTLSGVLSAGGALYRKQALKAAAVEPRRLQAVTTRWNQLQEVGRYLKEEAGKFKSFGVYDVVRKVISKDVSFKKGK